MKKVLFSAAHAGFNIGEVPLGGGAAICHRLTEEWRRTRPFALDVLGPSVMTTKAPQHKDLVRYTELEYARFCRAFERAATERILQSDPHEVVVLSNDVSEGPDFKLLAEKGYSIYTIYHVDVVDYFVTFYLHSLVRPETTTRIYRFIRPMGLRGMVPDVLKLVWDKQEASVRYSKGLIVPSKRMKEVLLRCYPELSEARVHVLPWGSWESGETPSCQASGVDLGAPAGALKLLLLSRISPEKGQHQLLEALALWEKEADYPPVGVVVYLSGEAAYMMGKRYEKKLKELAHRLGKTQVRFVGYASDEIKNELYKVSDIYVFPSIHESYGLTMMEALKAGMPVLTTSSYGAREIFQPGMGEMIPEGPPSEVPRLLMAGLRRLWASRGELKTMGAFGARWAKGHDFSGTAAKLAALLASQ